MSGDLELSKDYIIIGDAIAQFVEYLEDNFEKLSDKQIKRILEAIKVELEYSFSED